MSVETQGRAPRVATLKAEPVCANILDRCRGIMPPGPHSCISSSDHTPGIPSKGLHSGGLTGDQRSSAYIQRSTRRPGKIPLSISMENIVWPHCRSRKTPMRTRVLPFFEEQASIEAGENLSRGFYLMLLGFHSGSFRFASNSFTTRYRGGGQAVSYYHVSACLCCQDAWYFPR